MCGIHGSINSKTAYSLPICNFIRQAFVANSLRGMDSSGVFQIGTTSKAVYLHKDAVNGSEFITQAKTESILRDADTSLFTVCHVRAKTQGAVNADNAHPFVGWNGNERILGVHNGSLNNWKSDKDAANYEVDSAWAIQKIAEDGHAAFSKFQGAYCIVWWDEEDPRKINFCRNDQRPMHFLFSKDGKHMLFASEAGMLAWLAERSKFESDGRIREMPVGKIITFDTSGDVIKWDITDAPKPVYTPTTSSYNNSHSYNYSTTRNEDENHRPIAYESDLRKWKAYLENGVEQASTPITSMHSSVRPMCEVGGSCDAPFPDDFGDEDDDYPPFTSTGTTTKTGSPSFAYEGDFKFPPNLIPPRRHLEASDREIDNAKQLQSFGALAVVEWEMFAERNKQMFGTAYDEVSGAGYDVVMNKIDKNSAKRMLDGGPQACCVIGVENDGTLVVHRATKRMQQFMAT